MVLGYATRIPRLLIHVNSPLVAHITESLGYVPPNEPDAVTEAPPKPPAWKPMNPLQELLNMPAVSSPAPIVSPEYARIDGKAKAAKPPKDWGKMVDLSDTDNRNQNIAMLKRHERMWSGHFGEIKVASHRIKLEPGT